jgi:toxin ParE1/3/4
VRARNWVVRLSAAADADLDEIVAWTARRFGPEQGRVYASVLFDAITALVAGPKTLGARARTDIGTYRHTLHVARKGRRGSHVIVFQITSVADRPTVEVLRVLHDSMDVARHVPAARMGEGGD